MLDYSTSVQEIVPDYGVAECILANMCFALRGERDREVIEMVLATIAKFLIDDDDKPYTEEQILAHCRKRVSDYSRWIEEIPKGIDFDIKPFYGAFFRSPFSDVNYYPVEPKQPELFREVLLRMFLAAGNNKLFNRF